MDKVQVLPRYSEEELEGFFEIWHFEFPKFPLTTLDLKNPHKVMGALLQIFDRLEINKEVIKMTPPEAECDEHILYYRDLCPIINVARVTKHLLLELPRTQDSFIYISQLMQPVVHSTFTMLYMLFNSMAYKNQKLKEIEPYEDELLVKRNQVKLLEDEKNRIQALLNEKAVEKVKRDDRLTKLDLDIKQLEEELKQEKELHDEETHRLNAVNKELRQVQTLLEQKKTHRDSVIAEVAHKKALRVYDADDIKVQLEQAAKNVKEADEKLNLLRETLAQKETNIKNLQKIKPTLDTANNYLHDIMKLSDNLRDYDDETDVKDDPLETLNAELADLNVQLSEVKSAREVAAEKYHENHVKRQEQRVLAQSSLRKSEERQKKHAEESIKAAARIQEIKDMTIKYQQRKQNGMDEVTLIKNNFDNEISKLNESVLKKLSEVKKSLENKLANKKL